MLRQVDGQPLAVVKLCTPMPRCSPKLAGGQAGGRCGLRAQEGTGHFGWNFCEACMQCA